MLRRLMQLLLMTAMAAVCTAQPQRAPSAPAGWRTYHSADYGFTIDYPADMTFYSGHPIPPPHRSMIPVCDDTTVACFEYNGHAFDGTTVEAIGVSINILRDEATEADCADIDDIRRASKAALIHGIRFHFAQIRGAAAGHSEGGTVYRVFHQHICYEIALNRAFTDVGPEQFNEEGVHPVDQRAVRAVQDQMHRMLDSFRFAGPVRDGAEWRPYPDSESTCDGQFEVPFGADVEEVNPASQNGVYSSGVTCAVTFADRDRLYLIAENVDLGDSHRIDEWLAKSAFPNLAHARRFPNGTLEYRSTNLAYFVIHHELIVFAVSNPANGSQPERDRVFDHLVGSFRMP
jgi:hypothetical protein